MKFAAFVLFAVLLSSNPAWAQSVAVETILPRGLEQAGPGGGLATLLLRMSDVQHDLDMDLQQQISLRQQLAKSSRQRRSFFTNLVEGRVFEEELSPEETRQVLDLYNDYHDELLLKVLSSQQAERLAQIRYQLQGPAALVDPDMARQVGLSPQQQQRISKLIRSGNVNRSQSSRLVSSHDETLSILTAEQQLRWRQLQGKRFDFVELRKRAAPSLAPTATQLVSRHD